MPKREGYEVWVESGGSRLEEHSEDEKHGRTTCWISSTVGHVRDGLFPHFRRFS